MAGRTSWSLRSSRVVLPILAVVAVALAVTVGLLARWGRSPDGTGAPRSIGTATPPDPGPPGPPAPPARLPEPSPRVARPNIVMVVADDMRTDDLRWMPQVRELVQDRGLTFENSFSPNPICAPARASLLTGQASQNNGVLSVGEDNAFSAFDDRRTIATSLTAAGYDTLFLGKYMNGYGEQASRATGEPSLHYVPPGWTHWHALVTSPPGSPYTRGGTYDYYDGLYVTDGGRVDQSQLGVYQTVSQARLGSRMLRRQQHADKPFLLYYAPITPHFGGPAEIDDPRVTKPDGSPEEIKTPARPDQVRGHFDSRIGTASGLPRDGGPSERDVRDKPRPMRSALELSPAERVAVRTSTRQRAETLLMLDRAVGRLVRTLKHTGEYDDTVIVFTSDNGYFLGEHRQRQGKLKPHEPSLRVPFLVAGPGVPHGRRYDPVTSAGVAATVLDLAGARAPRPADGVSVVPSFAGDRGWRIPVVTEGLDSARVFRVPAARRAAGFHDARTQIGIRTGRWKYVRYVDGDGELYDLDADPNELTSHYDDPRYARVQARLQQVWSQYADCAGASCRAPLPRDLRRTAAQDAAATRTQERLVERRYGHR